MANARVLIIEDDADINAIVATHLRRLGYTCTQAFSGTEARLVLERSERTAHADGSGAGAHEGDQDPTRQSAKHTPFDLVICDLMLPGLTGEELVELIRARDAAVPIIVISARTATTDRIDLLKLGADDYLTKPFDLGELAARIEVQLRHAGRSGHPARDAATLRFRAWKLDPEARTFSAAGQPVALTRTEFNLVETLMRHPRRVFSKQELFEAAWGEPYAADDNTVNVHMSNIRAKLRTSGTDGYIKTVWGMGFKLVEE